ncbi:formyltransferase family protein [Alkalilacustris brevis]|uniref:formyltransferase family protein n=1 Tax=Alkalilacustris brevis TaxID=2026338 RepID=UPI000E0DEBD0|nr:formyltransferase family protein [Alkalilacustris brevis]
MRVVILTGDELRHRYFRAQLASDPRIDVAASICEGNEKSLAAVTDANPDASLVERRHVAARSQGEVDFFGRQNQDSAPIVRVPKGAINDVEIVEQIKALNCDLLVCYGSSLIRSDLLTHFQGRFLNVHLGLSPYYRGSGCNVWPMVNQELHMVGATFMHIDEGIDTGQIIHQIRAEVFLGDGPHAICNRLIGAMTEVYADLIARFEALKTEDQPNAEGRLYRQAEWNEAAALKLYQNFRNGMVEDHLDRPDDRHFSPIVMNRGLPSA